MVSTKYLSTLPWLAVFSCLMRSGLLKKCCMKIICVCLQNHPTNMWFHHVDIWHQPTTSTLLRTWMSTTMFWVTSCSSTKMHPLFDDLYMGIPRKSFLAKALKIICGLLWLGRRLAAATSVGGPLSHTWGIATCLEHKQHWNTQASIEHDGITQLQLQPVARHQIDQLCTADLSCPETAPKLLYNTIIISWHLDIQQDNVI